MDQILGSTLVVDPFTRINFHY
ncbi:hypothetical protein C5167_033422 [Papaver somniferum]|uniref:Uncharacterized protein n=1 Tax=Papaver somniferum TaxID=3469 RepID=A0A4Y7KA99_PAPSO|nr:hypothetical protein C5167_033422 [Papaver somniferum]